MKKLSKFFNNPFLLLIAFALTWGLTRDFFYLTYVILGLVTTQVILEKLAHSNLGLKKSIPSERPVGSVRPRFFLSKCIQIFNELV